MTGTMLSYVIFTFQHTAWHWIQRLGGPGLIIVGVVDSSVIPFPGGMDFFTILLAMSHHEPWWYYAIMATVGSVIGSYFTYRVGLKGGEETLEKRFSGPQAKKIYAIFEKRGFPAVALGVRRTAAHSGRPILSGARSFEIPAQEISGRCPAGAIDSLRHHGVSRLDLRTCSVSLDAPIRRSDPIHASGAGCGWSPGRLVLLEAFAVA